MLQGKRWSKDHLGALLLIALGAAALVLGIGYRMGTLNRMGAGFIPVVLGTLLIAVGVVIGLTAGSGARAPAARHAGAEPATQASSSLAAGPHGPPTAARGPQWRGWLCILGGVVAFVVFGEHGGLAPAAFASVFIAALGDRDNNVKRAAVLASLMVVFATIVFHFGLKLPLPLFQWG